MPITQANISAAQNASGVIFFEGTVKSKPAAGSTTITISNPNGSGSFDPVGKYLYLPASERSLRKILTVSALDNLNDTYDITVEFPFDMSEFRAYTKLDGSAFTATIPEVDDNYTISIDMDDLVDITQDTNLTPSATGVSLIDDTSQVFSVTQEGVVGDDTANTGVQLPANCAFVQESGTVKGGVFRNLIMNKDHDHTALVRFGRLHPGDTSDLTGDYYTSGGVTILDEDVVTSTGDLLGANIGHSVQLISGVGSLVNSTEFDGGSFQFLRMYEASDDDNDREIEQTNMLIDWEFKGNIGIRIAGDRTFVKNFTYQDGAWRGINFRVAAGRTFGQIAGIKAQDSDNLFYQNWDDSGDNTIIDGFEIINPLFDSSNPFKLVQNFGGDGGKKLTLKNWDITKWRANEGLGTQVRFSSEGSNSTDRVIAARDVDVSLVDSNNAALDSSNPAKLYIHTTSSSTSLSFPDGAYTNEITDGSGDFATQLVEIRDFKIGGTRRFAATPSSGSGTTDVEYVNTTKPALINVRSRRYNSVFTSSDLYDGDAPFATTAIMLDDPFHSDTALATIDTYTELETAQKTYDYAKKTIYDHPDHITTSGNQEFFSDLNSTSDILTPTTDQDIRISTSNLTGPYANLAQDLIVQGTGEIVIRTSTDSTEGSTTAGFEIPTSDIYIYNTIKGYLNCTNINFATGHQIVDGSTLIDTNHTVNGNIDLPAGTYDVTGGARVSGLTVGRSGATGTVTISLVNFNEDDGIPQIKSGDEDFVIIQRATEVTYTLEGDDTYTAADFTYVAREFATSDDNDRGAITATVTADNATNSFKLKFDAGHDSYIRIATYYKGYRFTELQTSEGEHFITLSKYTTLEMDPDAIDNADAAIGTYAEDTTWSYVYTSDQLRITAPDTNITIPNAPARTMVYYALAGKNGTDDTTFLEEVAKGNMAADVIEFDNTGIVVKASDFDSATSPHNKIRIDHITTTNKVLWNIKVLDTDGEDRNEYISDTTNIQNEIRFDPLGTTVFINNAVADKFSTDVAADLDSRNVKNATFTNLGLGLPIVNDAGDAFETTPTTPS